MATIRNTLTFLTLCAVAAGAVGACSSDDNGAPLIYPLSDRFARVDSEFTLEIAASDPDNDAITFGFTSDITNISNRTKLQAVGNKAVFRWTPNAADVGMHQFDFTASDGQHTVAESIAITVQPAEGASTAPIFRKPIGTGTTLDVTKEDPCVELAIVVDDADTTEVTIGQDEPVIPGSKLDQHSEFEATWSWCPSKEQIAEAERYVVKLFADDGENDKVTKPFLVVLWDKSSPQACSDAAFGTPPVIKHQAEDRQTIKDITLTAEVTDDLGISSAPFLFYATEEPENPPERMMMLQMKLGSGDRKSGTWTAVVPNPVAAKSAGSSAQLYYFIAAQDDDDKKGDCDNLTVAPNQGTYAITVTNSGGSGTLGVCEPCSADAQCGSDAGLCTRMGSASNSYCLRECSGPQDCTEPGYYCSVLKHESVDGTSARQCFPTDLECEIGGAGTCQDDNWEENDTLEEANLGPSFETKNHTGLVSCPGPSGTPDDDFYWLDVPQGGAITATLNGSKETDLDLMLLNGAGAIYAESNGLASSEVVSACVPAGVYYLRVYSLGFERNTYDLSYELGTCAACHDDPSEPDGNPDKARRVDLSTGPYKSETDAICANNEDWFRVPLSKGQTLYATLTFSRGNASDDLDLLLFRESTLLTQCTEAQPGGCDPSNGQGVEENESMVWPVQADGTYYVVARGWAGSENLYDICIGLSRAACPVPE